jgi:hypothetical protein
MKRKAFLVFGVLLVLGFVSFPCSAQSTNETQKFVGTWNVINADNAISGQYVFRADGTGTYESGSDGSPKLIYAIPVSGKIVLRVNPYDQYYSYEYYFIDGNNTLIFYAPGVVNNSYGGRIMKKQGQ